MIINCKAHILHIILLLGFANGVSADAIDSPGAVKISPIILWHDFSKITNYDLEAIKLGLKKTRHATAILWPVTRNWVQTFQGRVNILNKQILSILHSDHLFSFNGMSVKALISKPSHNDTTNKPPNLTMNGGNDKWDNFYGPALMVFSVFITILFGIFDGLRKSNITVLLSCPIVHVLIAYRWTTHPCILILKAKHRSNPTHIYYQHNSNTSYTHPLE